MPELPECETIKKQLNRHLPAKVESVTFSDVSASIVKVKNFSPKGRTLLKIRRKGKVLDFVFDDGNHIISGLGMSGSWQYSKEKITEKHTHILFKCTNKNGTIYIGYVDARRFGNSYFENEEDAKARLDKLGVDIGSKKFTGEHIYKLLQDHAKRELKPFMLDQKYFAGIGNYIASEMCAHAGIRPTRLAGSLTLEECERLSHAAKIIIDGSVKRKGLTFHGGYVDATGKKGNALDTLVVFHQEVCGLCEKTKVKRIEQKNRATYYCPNCQK